ncbi:MAG TPA: condensation domain-containing protein, partial [Actinomycetota bacterium]|nr:condensation domain-containing protein [Actinomycetota bacterium]
MAVLAEGVESRFCESPQIHVGGMVNASSSITRPAAVGPARRAVSDPALHSFPASFGQERVWVLEHLTPDVPLYMHAFATRLRGALDLDALERAIEAVVERHEVLRTRFAVDGGSLRQIVDPALGSSLHVVDLRSEPEARRDDVLAATVERLADETVDIDRGPLFKATLVRVADDDQVLVVVLHHIVSDGWSMGVLDRDLTTFYNAFVSGRDRELPDLPIQYADFAAWQKEYLSGDRLAREVEYWRDRLAGAPALLELPADRPRPPIQTFDGAAVTFDVSKATTDGLRAIASERSATLFMVLLAAFDVLLLRYTGRDDLTVATPVAGRTRSETEELIGFFVNTLVLRSDLSGDPSFADLVDRTREVALEAYGHQDLPFEKLVEELNPERDLSHLPLAQVMFVLQNASAPAAGFAGVDPSPIELEVDMAPYDLTLEVTEIGQGLRGSFIYNTDLFDRETAEQMSRHFVTLLEGLVRDPSTSLSRVPILDADERD